MPGNISPAPDHCRKPPAAEITAIQLDAAWGVYLYRTLPQAFEEYSRSLTGFCHSFLDAPDGASVPGVPPQPPALPAPPAAVPAGIEARRVRWVNRGKAAKNYEALVQGATLRIEPTGDLFEAATYQAEIFGLSSPATATVSAKFRKAGGHVRARAFETISKQALARLIKD